MHSRSSLSAFSLILRVPCSHCRNNIHRSETKNCVSGYIILIFVLTWCQPLVCQIAGSSGAAPGIAGTGIQVIQVIQVQIQVLQV